MATTKLDADLQGTPVDQTKYHSMIGGLMYLTAKDQILLFATFMQTMQGVMMIAKAHPEAFNFWETSYHLDANTTAGLWISLPQDSDLPNGITTSDQYTTKPFRRKGLSFQFTRLIATTINKARKDLIRLIFSMAGVDDENLPPPVVTPTQQAPHTVSTIKLPILKEGNVSTDTNGQIKVLPPKTVEEILARERERKARTTLLMAIPEDLLSKFHNMTDAKEMWDAFKSRFGGNDESKKMQKYILKKQFEGVSTEDANQKFLSLRVFKTDVKGSTGSSSSAQNVAFVSSESTSSTNDKIVVLRDEKEVSGVQKVRPENQIVKTRDDKSGQNSHKQGVGFRKVKAYFVCKSTEHLIKDCNFHNKKSQESNLKNVVNTGKRESKPVWDSTKRVNHPNFSKYPHLSETFVPAGVSTRTGTSLRHALTHNPTIHDSLVKQFWQTATVRTLANGTQQLIASINSTEYTITEASVRSKGSAQPAEPHHTPVDPLPSTSLPPIPSPPHSPHQSPPHSPHQSPPHSPHQSTPHSPHQSPPYLPPHYSPPRSYEAPFPECNTSGSVETGKDSGKGIKKKDIESVRESMKMKEKSTDFVTPTKASGEAQEEDNSPTILEAAKTLSKVASQGVSKKRLILVEKKFNIGIEEGLVLATYKTKEQLRQEEAGLGRGYKIASSNGMKKFAKQIHLDEMIAKRMVEEEALSEQQKKRKSQVQFEAQYYTEEDWDAIRAKLEANAS
ncbi:hypothetical protein Tco_0179846 [Tanacetum coccineum]